MNTKKPSKKQKQIINEFKTLARMKRTCDKGQKEIEKIIFNLFIDTFNFKINKLDEKEKQKYREFIEKEFFRINNSPKSFLKMWDFLDSKIGYLGEYKLVKKSEKEKEKDDEEHFNIIKKSKTFPEVEIEANEKKVL